MPGSWSGTDNRYGRYKASRDVAEYGMEFSAQAIFS